MLRAIWIVLIFCGLAVGQEPIAIRNAVVETLAAAGRLDKATVVIRNGKIEAVGIDVPVPDDAKVIDAVGGTVMPGLIDPFFEVAVAAATADAGPRTISFGGRTVPLPAGVPTRGGAFTRIADNFYPYDAGFRPLPRVGLTRLNLVTAGGGQSAVVRVTPQQPAQMLDRADGIAFVNVSNQTEVLDQIRSRLEAAARAKTGGGSSNPASAMMARFGGAASSAGNQMWADVHDGKVPLIATAANSAAILHVLKLVEPYKNVKLTLFAPGPAVAETIDLLKGKGVRVITRPGLDLWPNTRDRFSAAKLLHQNGVEVAFSLTARAPAGTAGGLDLGGPTEESPATFDFPLFPIAFLVKAGLPRNIALEALTKRPAMILGLDATHGTIEPGKAADLLLFTGDPLDTASQLRLTLIDGRTTHANE